MAERQADTAAKARAWLLDIPPGPAPVSGYDALPILEARAARQDYQLGKPSRIADMRAALIGDGKEGRVEFACIVAADWSEPERWRERDVEYETAPGQALWLAYGTARTHRQGTYIDELGIAPLLPDQATLPRAIDSRVMRAVKPAEVLAYLRGELLEALDWADLYEDLGVETITDEERTLLRETAQPDQPRRRGKRSPVRRRRPPEFFKQLALVYLELQAKSWKRGIRAELVDRLALDELDARNVPDLIRRARELGYLTFSKQGRAGAEPGPKLLAQQDASTKRPGGA